MIQEISYPDWVFIALVSILSALAAVWWLTPRRHADKAGNTCRDKVFLFDGGDMIDASSEAQKFAQADKPGFNWTRLHDALIRTYPGFPKSPKDIKPKKPLIISAIGQPDNGEVVCERVDGIIRVCLHDRSSKEYQPTAVLKELETLRQAMGQAPYPVWHVDPDGDISWFNAAYDSLCKKVAGDNTDMPPPMFPSASGKGQAGKKTRTSVAVSGSEQKLWYDVTVIRQSSGLLCYAIDINAVVDAEIAQRNFVQTLAKTFAQLSIGLAIFDRKRQLALFNPALIDLTALPADFLSARPNLLSFFDRLRDQRMMPEPKNYGSWRHQMADLVAAAADGRYQETWTLPSGAVYSVSGRPHPDGAVAFLIEDITAEITLTRRFRTDLEINQSMMDQMEDAISVFSNNGALCFSNRAYRELWNVDPEASFVQLTVLDATRTWQGLCHATPVLGEIRDFVGLHENRVDWWAEIRMLTGQSMTCCVFPISHGATMVVFSAVASGEPLAGHEPPERRIEQAAGT